MNPRTKMKRGRRSLLTPAVQKEICGLLAKGNTIRTTVGACGISERVYFDWCEVHPHFAQATSRARAQAKVRLVKVLVDAAKLDWRSAAWLLSHCWPEEFSESRVLQPAPSAASFAPTKVVVNVRRSAKSDAEAELYGERPADLERDGK
jgi:hypothetical protein